MKILLVYPQYPETFWSFKHALSFIRKKAMVPPLGLLTIASMLPDGFETKLIDLNIESLEEKDLLWADFVFISAMITQKDSVYKIVDKCKKLNVKTVAGGPLFIDLHTEFPDIDYFVLDEGEVTLPLFLEDLKNKNLQKYYRSNEKPDIKKSPIPKWKLVNQKAYGHMPIQYSRGCPYDCEFCGVVRLNGRVPRTKTPDQVIRELEALCDSGWNGPVFFVDDNFIGNKKETKSFLKSLAQWRNSQKAKLTFNTEVSLNVADDEELMRMLRNAGFNSLFIGLETPSEESLNECGKLQNKNRNIEDSLITLYRNGFQVSAGFIVGFDSDDTSIFKRQIDFIQNSGVVVAMVGLLNVLPGTRLYKRLQSENRLLHHSSGNNTDFSINFIPKINTDVLIEGYKEIVKTVYNGKEYYDRVLTFIKHYNTYVNENMCWEHLYALFKSIICMGILDETRFYYWKAFFISLFKYPHAFTRFIATSVYYAHFKRVFVDCENKKFTTNYNLNANGLRKFLRS